MTKEKEVEAIISPESGVFVTKDMLITIPPFTIWINDDGSIANAPVTLHTELDLCTCWLSIALFHLAESEKAHALLMEGKRTEDAEKIAVALREDFMAGMQTIMASVLSIDAYYASIKQHVVVPEKTRLAWRDNRTARYRQITEVFCMAFKISGEPAKNLRENLKQLFLYRDKAVHPVAGTNPPALHTELNKITDWRYSTFRNYNAKDVVKTVLSIVDQASNKGNAKNIELNNYCKIVIARIEPILNQWKNLYEIPS